MVMCLVFFISCQGKRSCERKHDSAFCASCRVTESRNNVKNAPEPGIVPPWQGVPATARTPPLPPAPSASAAHRHPTWEFGSFQAGKRTQPSVFSNSWARISQDHYRLSLRHFKHLPFLGVPVPPSLFYFSGTLLPRVVCVLPYTIIFAVCCYVRQWKLLQSESHHFNGFTHHNSYRNTYLKWPFWGEASSLFSL